MDTKKILAGVVGVAAIGGGSFFGGMKLDAARHPASQRGAGVQGRFVQMGAGTNGPRGGRGLGGFTAGEVIAKDDKSITVKLTDGGSKIIFLTPKTEVMKSVSGAAADLTIGAQVSVNGANNPDGSVNATAVQIRPTLPSGTTGNVPKQ